MHTMMDKTRNEYARVNGLCEYYKKKKLKEYF